MNIDANHFVGKINFEGMQGNEEVKICLFVVSKKVYRLKKIDLKDLSREQGNKKLLQWSQEHRFVAIVEVGDQIYAHANQKMAKQLEENGVALNDKKVIVKALSDEEYAHLATVAQAFGEYLLAQSSNKNGQEGLERIQSTPQSSSFRDYLATTPFLNGQLNIQDAVDHLMNKLSHQAVTNILARMAETRRELDEQQRKEQKSRQIQMEEIQKETVKHEIKKQMLKNEEDMRTERKR